MGNQGNEEMESIASHYEKTLQFHRFWSIDDDLVRCDQVILLNILAGECSKAGHYQEGCTNCVCVCVCVTLPTTKDTDRPVSVKRNNIYTLNFGKLINTLCVCFSTNGE